MPSFQWFKPFSKKKGHGGSKFHDYHHGYDNLRHSAYPATSPAMMGQQNQYNQVPPHSFPHRQHLYPQQLVMHSPPPPASQLNQSQHQFQAQVITTTTNQNHNTAPLAHTNHHHCQCNQCSFQQPQMQLQASMNNNHQLHSTQHQLIHHQQSQPAQNISQTQMSFIDNQMPMISSPQQQQQQPQPQPQQQQQQQQQQQPQPQVQQPQQQLQQQQLPQSQPVQIPQIQTHQQCHQHTHQPTQVQQPVYQCQNSFVHNGYVNYTSNTLPQAPQSQPQAFSQCTCQHCPYQQQQQQQSQQQSLSSQQQQPQQQHFIQQLDHTPTNGTCQRPMSSSIIHSAPGMNGNQSMTHLQGNTHPVSQQQQTCQSQHMPQQTLSTAIMASTTPGAQPQSLTTVTHHTSVANQTAPQFQYHTIQPTQYQQQKQQFQHQQTHQQQQQQHHHRVQSLHHQQPQAMKQLTHQSLQGAAHMAQSQNQLAYRDPSPEVISQPQQCQLESRVHDYSRYANMESLIDNTHSRMDYSRPTSKYQEHVYYNQKPELPPYEPPPDYDAFMEHRKMYSTKSNGQHMTHHSESLVLRKDKDSSYENLRTKSSLYSNLCISRQEPGYTS